ncbi:MAG: molybdopterin-dependent oxidoreductase [Deltaproteobacteria bacterium]|nr:molybdopterin-dependent oxidoreductase [Deltaproteobacteria bacterium]
MVYLRPAEFDSLASMENSNRAGNEPSLSSESGAVPQVRLEPTTCILDCPDACALEVAVETGPNGDRVTSLRGRSDHPTTAGFICNKVSRFHRRVYSPERILTPLRRKGEKGSGEFEAISWRDALAEIAGRFGEIRQEWGGEAILPYHYGGSNGLLEDGFLDDYFFARMGASRLASTICAMPTSSVNEEMYGKMPGVAYEDFAEARFILIWGANPKVSGIHLIPFLRQAKKSGAFVAVVDPLQNFSSREVDLHLPAYPGTDLPLALGMIHRWQGTGSLAEAFLDRHSVGRESLLEAAAAWPVEKAAEEARVPVADLRRLADVFAASSPAVVRCGWGVERNRNGGAAAAAIMAMPTLLGKFGVAGGGFTMSNNGAAKVDREALLGTPKWQTRIINMTRLAEALEAQAEKPIKGIFVYNCNPVATVPDQRGILRGLAREDLFTVVSEQVMTDTARYADVILPATTFLEQREIRVGYGSYSVGGIQPVIEPVGESRTNTETFAALGKAMGWQDEVFSWDSEEAFRRVAAGLEVSGKPAEVATLEAGRSQSYDFPGDRPVQFGNVFPRTSDAKVDLNPPCLGKAPYSYLPLESPFPLALVSPGDRRLINSTFGESSLDELTVTLHPEDAEARGLAPGDSVRAFNDLGEVHCRARVSSRTRPGVVLMPKGAWRRASDNGFTSTALCPSDTQRVGGGACFSDARVEVERLAD